MIARLLGVAERTIRRWKRNAGRPMTRRGRPPRAHEYAELRRIARELREQGYGAGWRPVAAALPEVAVRIVQRVLARLKARRRARAERRRVAERIRIQPAGIDVLWSLDATHIGRSEQGVGLEAQAVRDVASTKTLAVTAGEAPSACDAIAVMSAAIQERGHAPLAVATDNGAPYVSAEFECFLAARGVLHLKSLPHTPRHNPWVERGHRDLKEESGLGRGIVIASSAQAAERLAAARERIDQRRLRAKLGYRTAAAIDAEMRVPYDESVREALAERVRSASEERAQDNMTKRERRMQERQAVLASLEEQGLIERTRGGRPLRAVKEDRIT